MNKRLWFPEDPNLPTNSPWAEAHQLRHGRVRPSQPDDSADYLRQVISWLKCFQGKRIGFLDVDDLCALESGELAGNHVILYLWNRELEPTAQTAELLDLAFQPIPHGAFDVLVLGHHLYHALPDLPDLAMPGLAPHGILVTPSEVDLSAVDMAPIFSDTIPVKIKAWRKTRVRVLLVAPGLVRGGADRALLELIQGLDERQFSIYLATTEPLTNEWVPKILGDVEEYWDLGSLGTDDLIRQRMLQHLVSVKRIDLMYIMHSQVGFDALPWIKSHSRIRTIVQFHLEEPGGGWIRYATSRYQNLIDHYVVISEDLKQQLIQKYYVEPHKISVVYLGVPVPPAPTPMPPLDAGLQLLYPARLDAQKAPLRLLEIGTSLKKMKIRATIHVVGTGPLLGELQQGIKRARLESAIVLHGAADPEAMSLWYQKSHAILLTSNYEGLPLVVLEAMAQGRTVIAPDLGATKEVVTSSTGFLIADPSDINSYLKALGQLDENPLLLTTLGHAAYLRVAWQFDMTRTMNLYHQIFLEAAGMPFQSA